MTIEWAESESEFPQKRVNCSPWQDIRPFIRDLHDLVGSVLSALVLKCELACRLALAEPDQVAVELREIASISERARLELQEIAAYRHQARLADDIALAQSVLTAAGVQLTVTGAETALPGVVEQALAAVLRESVLNLLCHSAATHCWIRIGSAGSSVSISIVNDSSIASPLRTHPETMRTVRFAKSSPGGLGLVSLSLRVADLGGTFSSRRRPDGGYAVRATVPLDQPAASRAIHGECWPGSVPETRQDKRRWECASRDLASVGSRCLAIERYCGTAPRQAQADLADVAETARRVLGNIRALIAPALQAREAEQESSSVRAMLAAAGIRSTVRIDADLPGPVYSAMITILREGVVNVLRHEEVRHCEVSLRQTGSEARLDILNDGVYPCAQSWFGASTETQQMVSWLQALGGTLTVRRGARGSVALHARVGVVPARREIATASPPRARS